MSAILQVQNLTKRFGSGADTVCALNGLDVQVEAGQFLAVMGASGSGKSTLLHLVGGLDTPDGGAIQIEGRDLVNMSDRQRTLFRRERIGVIFQAYNLLPTLSAAENIGLPMLVAGEPQARVQAKTEELLQRFHLEHRASHKPAAMAGGEQQRVAIARALLNDPALILADEPTGNLDSVHSEEIWRLLAELTKEFNKAVIMVTHEAAGAAHADRVLVLKDGAAVGEIETSGVRDASLVATRYQELAS